MFSRARSSWKAVIIALVLAVPASLAGGPLAVNADVVANACPVLHAGDILRVEQTAFYYQLNANLQLLYFPNSDVQRSWAVNGSDSSTYTGVSVACYDALKLPGRLPFGADFFPGTYLVKDMFHEQLYVVEPHQVLVKITPEAALALYGLNGLYKTQIIDDVQWYNYVISHEPAITMGSKPHPGMLLSAQGKIWFVADEKIVREVTPSGLAANRFQLRFARPMNDLTLANFNAGPKIDGKIEL